MRVRGRIALRTWAGLAALGAGVAAAAGWGRPDPGSSTTARHHVINIRGMAFHPAVLVVSVGDTVEWVNGDLVPHTAAAKPAWDTGPVGAGQRVMFVPHHPGRFEYVCAYHPVMQGELTVR